MPVKLINCDAMDFVSIMQPVKCIFLDPPDNLSIQYDVYNDSLSSSEYYNWLELIILKALGKCEILWISYYPSHDLELKYIIRNAIKYRHQAFNCKTFIWRFTFGQYNDNDCGYGYRPIVRLKRIDAKIYPDEIRIESERMKSGDKRSVGPKVPDNVFDYARIVGNSKEKRLWHQNQHPEKLMERIIKFSCNKDETFVDLFSGTGTSLRVCKYLNINNISIELSKNYCEMIANENDIIITEYCG